MLNFPTIRHAITISIHHGWICANINRVQASVRRSCLLTKCFITDVNQLRIVVTIEVGFSEEVTKEFRTVEKTVHVRITLVRKSRIVSFFCSGNVAVFLEICPPPVHDISTFEPKPVNISIEKSVPRVGRIQPVTQLPAIRHAIAVGIVCAGVHEFKICKSTR